MAWDQQTPACGGTRSHCWQRTDDSMLLVHASRAAFAAYSEGGSAVIMMSLRSPCGIEKHPARSVGNLFELRRELESALATLSVPSLVTRVAPRQ